MRERNSPHIHQEYTPKITNERNDFIQVAIVTSSGEFAGSMFRVIDATGISQPEPAEGALSAAPKVGVPWLTDPSAADQAVPPWDVPELVAVEAAACASALLSKRASIDAFRFPI